MRAVTWTHANGVAPAHVYGLSQTVTLGFTPSAGSLLIVAAWAGAAITFSITDNSSGPADSWTALSGTPVSWQYSGNTFEVWATNITTGTAPTTVTVSISGSTSTNIIVLIDNYTGGPNPFVQDGSAAISDPNSTGTSPSVSFTTGSAAGDLLWSVVAGFTAESSITVASPFTLETTQSETKGASADDGIPSGVAAGTQYTANWTLTSTAEYYCACIVGFEAGVSFQPDEDYWASQPPGAADPTVTVFE